jgi:predicted dehydrogenase
MRVLNVGILGLGKIGKTHAYAYRNLPFFYENIDFKVHLKAVYNRSWEKALQNRETYGFEYAAKNPEDIINDPGVDIVDICLPNFLHEEYAVKAFKAGKHVYLEKPAAMDWAGALRIAEAAKKAGTVNQVVFHNRFYPAVLRAKELIDGGRIGRIFGFSFVFNHPSNISKEKCMSWRFEKEKTGGGALFDMGSHIIDLACHLMGPFEGLEALTQIAWDRRKDEAGNLCTVETDDAAYIVARLKNGACGTIAASKLATGTNDDLRFEIYGEKGALKFDVMDLNYLQFYDNTQPVGDYGGSRGFTKIESVQNYKKPAADFPYVRAPMGWIRAHVQCLYNFLDCAAHGQAASPDIAEAAYTQYIMDKAYESGEKKRWITLEQ